MNSHEQCLGQTQDYFAGRLDALERLTWEAHRDACPGCGRIIGRWPHEALVPDLKSAVLSALPRAHIPFFNPEKAGPAWVLPLASAAALALLLSAFWRPQRQWVQDDTNYGATCEMQCEGGQACCAD